MDCKLILAAVYAAAAVISMAVTACSAIETKKILGEIEKELSKGAGIGRGFSKDADDGNYVFIPDICPYDLSPVDPDSIGTDCQGRKCGCTRCKKRWQ